MSFDQYVEAARSFAGDNPAIVSGGAGLLFIVLTLLIVRLRRPRQPAVFDPTGTLQATNRVLDLEKAATWEPPEQSYADRRGAIRREGGPVRIVLSSPSFRNGVTDGFVVDRSTGGLKILMQGAVAPGSTLQVRAVNAPDTVAFVTVIVRSCRKTGDHFEVGCEFEKTPPWNVLLLFG